MVAEPLRVSEGGTLDRTFRRPRNWSFTTKGAVSSKKSERFIRRSTSCDELAMCRSNRAVSPVIRAVSPFYKEAVNTYKTTSRCQSHEFRDTRRKSAKRRTRSRNSVSRERSYSSENRQIQSKPLQKRSSDVTKNENIDGCIGERRTAQKKMSIKNLISFPTNSLLHSAVVEGDIELAQRLLVNDPSAINKLSLEGTAPIHEAAINGDTDCMQLLIKYGANLEVKDKNYRTPVEYAVLVGNFDCAALLLSYGASDEKIRDGIPQL